MYTHQKNIKTAGLPLHQAQKALVMVHGRGATADSILSLSQHFQVPDFALVAPQATNNTWYPYSFMAPESQNQPGLESAINLLSETVTAIKAAGIKPENIYFLGFSQGACLTVEYTSREAQKYGGIIIFTGGLIGLTLEKNKYSGNFNNTPVLITTGNPDAHVPVSRVDETERLMQELGASVIKRIYPGRPHTILEEEIKLANQILSGNILVSRQ